MNSACIDVLGKMNQQSAPEVICVDPEQSDSSEEVVEQMDISLISKASSSIVELLHKLQSPDSSCFETIEKCTLGQSANDTWKRLRLGRITASNLYRVYTNVESYKQQPSVDFSKLVNSLLCPTSLCHLPQIARGIERESLAVSTFVGELEKLGHSSVTVQQCGLFIDRSLPFLGASPDGIVTCGCCPISRLLEIKYPSRDIDDLPFLEADLKLKHRSAYYGQVQGQMHVTGLKSTYFYIFSNKNTTHLHQIKYNKKYISKMVCNLEFFSSACLHPNFYCKNESY